ncbi:HU family DNA-binding protein [Dasania marina]|uniref:HU family DNA-binding protein n=1 Tax=Dasania marina TaxID=471499 RepID=UPI0030D80937|tara:strand:+ start:69476 stop:69754 length:279 start_codon:yes stop_codon:yes gene_type:complete
MRKPDLAAYIADKADLPTGQANDVLSAILDQITMSLSRKESVTLIGFGTFEVRHRNARTGKNPQTGAELQIAASNTVGFKAGKALKESVNKA